MEQPENNITDIEPETAQPSPAQTSRWAGLGTRIASAIVLAALFLAVLWQGGWIFTVLILMASMMMVKEWNDLNETTGAAWRAAGLFYSAIPCASILWMRGLQTTETPDAGLHAVLFLILIVSATDIGAYFTGRLFGKTKLSPVISPNKTWEGLGGGMALAAIAGALASALVPFSVMTCMALSILLAVIAQGGDLFESWLKRRAGVKDSGTLIPGHGGLLDRVDGLIFTAPLFAWCLHLSAHAAQ